jgi:hypothetical protein
VGALGERSPRATRHFCCHGGCLEYDVLSPVWPLSHATPSVATTWGMFRCLPYDMAILLDRIEMRGEYPALRAALLEGYCQVRPLAREQEAYLETRTGFICRFFYAPIKFEKVRLAACLRGTIRWRSVYRTWSS